jgi:type I restriction enzyme, S subunit
MPVKTQQLKTQKVPKLRFPGFSGAWEEKTIEKLVLEKIIDKPLDGNHGNIHPKSGDFVEEGIPFVMANDIKNSKVDLKWSHKISKKQADSLQKGFSKSDDVLLTHKGNIGFTAIVPQIDTEYIMLTPQVTYYRVTDKNRLNNIFLRYIFDSNNFQKDLKTLSGGGTRPYVGITEQRKIKIALPEISEQQKIAGFLSSVNEWLENLRDQKKSLESYKNGMMQKIFSQEIRFKNDNGKDFPEWEEKKLGEICIVKKGQQLSRAELPSAGKYPVINGGIEPSGYTDECNTNGNTITISEGGNSCGFVNLIMSDFWCGGHCYFLNLNKGADLNFIFYFLKLIEKSIMQLRVGSGLPNIQKKDIEKIKIKLPNIEEQRKSADFMESIDNLINLKQQQITQAEQWKNGLMQGLFV